MPIDFAERISVDRPSVWLKYKLRFGSHLSAQIFRLRGYFSAPLDFIDRRRVGLGRTYLFLDDDKAIAIDLFSQIHRLPTNAVIKQDIYLEIERESKMKRYSNSGDFSSFFIL